jgi:hypothetical protein
MREIAGVPRCMNFLCSSGNWRCRTNLNVIELTPSVALDPSVKGQFIGSLHLKEIRFVEDCECRGASISRVAAGDNLLEVRGKTAAEAKSRAAFYESRGYEVRLKAMSLPAPSRSSRTKQKDRLTTLSAAA